MDTVELTVHSEMYGETICVVDIETFLKGRKTFPCADGCDYPLRSKDIREINAALRERRLILNAYSALKSKHQEETNVFPMGFAFSNEQFETAMRGLGLEPTDTDKVVSIGAGAFCKTSDVTPLNEMLDRHRKELQDAIDSDSTGDGFIYTMFRYELSNHEFGYTWEADDTLDALGFTWDDINANPRLLHGLSRAMDKVKKEDPF